MRGIEKDFSSELTALSNKALTAPNLTSPELFLEVRTGALEPAAAVVVAVSKRGFSRGRLQGRVLSSGSQRRVQTTSSRQRSGGAA